MLTDCRKGRRGRDSMLLGCRQERRNMQQRWGWFVFIMRRSFEEPK